MLGLLLTATFGLGVAVEQANGPAMILLLAPLVALCRDVASVMRSNWRDAGGPHRA